MLSRFRLKCPNFGQNFNNPTLQSKEHTVQRIQAVLAAMYMRPQHVAQHGAETNWKPGAAKCTH